MNPFSLNPLHALAAAVLALAIGFAGGWLVNGWRLDGAHQKAISAVQADLATEQGKVREQNVAVDRLKASTDAADKRREQAEKFATAALKRIDSRSAAVSASQATDCDGVLREAWEKWK
ncbi:MAG: hypothetical protein ACXW2U_05530 [Telluria sp.]